MNYKPMNAEIREALLERGFVNTSAPGFDFIPAGCYFERSSGTYLLRVWLHFSGGRAEIVRDSYHSVARLPEFDTIREIDQFFKAYFTQPYWPVVEL